MKILKPVIEDEALSEVIFRIGTRRVYGLELLESYKFKEEHYKEIESEILPDKSRMTPKITQATLSRQLSRLVDEGFLIAEQGYDKNKKYYSVNINKIIAEFMLYSVDYIKALPIDTEWQKSKRLIKTIMKDDIKELANKKYIQECQKNILILEFFKTLILHIYQSLYDEKNPKFTLKEFFDYLLDNGVIAKLSREITQEYNSRSDTYNSRFDTKEYIFFEEFCKRYGNFFDRVTKRRFLYDDVRDAISHLYHFYFDKDYRKLLRVK